MSEKIIRDAEDRMKKAVESINTRLSSVRTGRASPALLEGVRADYYGTKTPINQMATISVPEPRMIVIQPWDKTSIKNIEKAIVEANIGLNPNVDKNVIRLILPELTEERRKELARHIHNLVEEGRVAVRNIRREANSEVRKLEKGKELSEDERYLYEEEIQEITDKYVEEVDELLEKKEKEIMEV
jgi:ribosome recycling factor